MAESPTPMTAEDLKAWIAGTIQDSVDHIDDEVSPVRASAFRYYLGAPFSDSGDSPAEEDALTGLTSSSIWSTESWIVPAIQAFRSSAVIAWGDSAIE